ncbi:hypothetical protein NL676_001636 [Syzygium grande]|nr:hypothetical protein NL676_001636 [Syzygium grande]
MVFKFRTFSFSNPTEDDPALPKSFSLQELQDATQNFSRDIVLGWGGFGTVYRGCLANGCQVAVKRARNLAQGTEKQFKTEMGSVKLDLCASECATPEGLLQDQERVFTGLSPDGQ